jgi:very-short-patch-repair endonuclease
LLACGPHAAIARRTALELWGVWRPTDRSIDVVVPAYHRPLAGVSIHETRILPPGHVRLVGGIRVTTPARTIVDLGLELDATQLANVIHQLAYRKRFNRRELVRCLRDLVGHPGQPVAKAALAMHDAGSAGTKSELERRVDALLLEYGIEQPVRNVHVETRIGWIELDKCWRQDRIYLEVDGPAHARPRTRNGDRDRRLALVDAGWREVRVGYLELDLDRAGVGARLAAALPRGVQRDARSANVT